MKLAAKLVLLFLVCLGVIVFVFAWLTTELSAELAVTEHEHHASDLAATLQASLEQSPRSLEQVDQTLTEWSRKIRHVRIRIVNPNNALGPSPSVPSAWITTTTDVITRIVPDENGERTMYTYVPLGDKNGHRLEVAAQERFWIERLVRILRKDAILLLVTSFMMSIAIMVGGYWMVAKPLQKLMAKVARVSQGDLDEPVNVSRSDELGKLAVSLNEMCTKLKSQRSQIETETTQRIAAVEQLRHADRLRTVGRLAAGLAHEIGTPLNVVAGRADLISAGSLSAEETKRSAEAIKSQARRITVIVRQLLDFARQSPPKRLPTSAFELLHDTVELIDPIAKKQAITIDLVDAEEDFRLVVDPSQIQQVLTNLIVNAIQASEAGERVTIELLPKPANTSLAASPLSTTQSDEPSLRGEQPLDYCAIRVSDTGCGIPSEELDEIFEPFFTTKDVGEGTGLGLSIAYGIIQEHGGEILVKSEVDVGTVFTVILPCQRTTVEVSH